MLDPEQERDARIALLLEEIRAELQDRGEIDMPSWQTCYPDLAQELPALVQTLRDLDTAVDDWSRPEAFETEEGSFPATSSRDQEPIRIGRYLLGERIGAGGMGKVYRAEDPQLRRVVALKLPRFDQLQRDRRLAVERFLREARAAAPIRHPHVCPIHDVGEHEGAPYVVMAYVEGESLAERLTRLGRYEDPRQAAILARQVAEALDAVHGHGIIHRDLKPSNILIDKSGQPVVTDFGLAHSTSDAERLTVEGAVVGTPAYMSPEQATGAAGAIGPASDIYSLGIVLYQMLTGRLPFEGPILAVLSRINAEPPPPPSRFREDLDPALEAIVLKAMARRPGDRYRSAREFAQALERWLQGTSSPMSAQLPTDAQPPTDTYVPSPAAPKVVHVDLPEGPPVKVTVDAGAAKGKLAVKVVDEPATKKRRRRVAVTVVLTFSLLIGMVLIAKSPWGSRPPDLGTDDPDLTAQQQKEKDRKEKEEQDRLAEEEKKRKEEEDRKRFAFDHKINRVRTPKVQITYEIETNGAMARVELPFVVGVLADLSGQPSAPPPPLAKRKFVQIDRDNFDEVLRRAVPRLALQVPNRLTPEGAALPVELSFQRFADFEPAAIAEQVPALKALLEKRRGLSAPQAIGEIDRQLSAQLAAVLHHPDFQRLEATWRGLHYLVMQSETGSFLKIQVLNVSKRDLASDLTKADEFEESATFKKLAEELILLGGSPYCLLVGDYEFGRDEPDVRLLQALANVSAHVQGPFVAAAGPPLLGQKGFTEEALGNDLAGRFAENEYAAWRSFRDSENSSFVALTLPRVLARLPYGAQGHPVPEFAFEELAGDRSADQFLWMNAAWAFAARVTDAQAKHGWPARIHGADGGKVAGLPAYSFPTNKGDEGVKRSTEIALSGDRSAELSSLGLLPVVQGKGQDAPVFLGVTTCHKPRAQPEPGAELPARLDALLCASRYAHYVRVTGRDKIGTFVEVKDTERWLNNWINNYTYAGPQGSPEIKAKHPLREARVEVREAKGRPGAYEVDLQLRPEYQLDPPLTAPVRLKLLLPRRE